MRAVVQRVTQASVTIDGQVVGAIGPGLAVLVGFCDADGDAESGWLARKITGLRVFSDDQGKMNLSLEQVQGQILVVPNFTLYGDVARGRRPSFTQAADPARAEAAFARFVQDLGAKGHQVQTGQFGQYMQVALVNDGPVTLILDTDQLE